MRLSQAHIASLKHLAAEAVGPDACLRLFGSRLGATTTGGDLDVLLELAGPVTEPATLAARLSARARRADGCNVDLALNAPQSAALAHPRGGRTGGGDGRAERDGVPRPPCG